MENSFSVFPVVLKKISKKDDELEVNVCPKPDG
jgi:hypothetical protein